MGAGDARKLVPLVPPAPLPYVPAPPRPYFFSHPPLLTRPVLVLFAFSVRAGKGVYSSEFEGRLAELRRTLG